MESLIPYVNTLIQDRDKCLQINSGNAIDIAVGDKSQLTANAKAEQIADDLYRLYTCLGETGGEVCEIIKNYFKGTAYSLLF